MATVTLWCAVAGSDASPFSVDVAANASLREVRDTIMENWHSRPAPTKLALYTTNQLVLLARHEPKYLTSTRGLSGLYDVQQLFNRKKLFQEEFSASEPVSLVLVVDRALSPGPSGSKRRNASLSTRRRDFINLMERMWQESKRGGSSQSTCSGTQTVDFDSQRLCSNLSWVDLEQIITMKVRRIQPHDVVEDVVLRLGTQIAQLKLLYGEAYMGKASNRRVFVEAILRAVCTRYSDVQIIVDKEVKDEDLRIDSRFDFLLRRANTHTSVSLKPLTSNKEW